jgi:hypothetical protein
LTGTKKSLVNLVKKAVGMPAAGDNCCCGQQALSRATGSTRSDASMQAGAKGAAQGCGAPSAASETPPENQAETEDSRRPEPVETPVLTAPAEPCCDDECCAPKEEDEPAPKGGCCDETPC